MGCSESNMKIGTVTIVESDRKNNNENKKEYQSPISGKQKKKSTANNENKNLNDSDSEIRTSILKKPSIIAKTKTLKNQTIIDEGIESQNGKRLLHGCPELIEDPDLSQYAQDYANELAEKDELGHSRCIFRGKNIGESCGIYYESESPVQFMTDLWYDEIKLYDFDNTSFGYRYNTVHFTQMIWKSTKYAGIGISKAKSGNWYFVCNYYPKGNEEGEYKENVPRLIE